MIISLETGVNIPISVDFQLKAMDNKMADEVNQRKGALCFSCKMTEADLHDVDKVAGGIYMDFTTEDLLQKFKSLAAEHDIPAEDWDDWEIPGSSKERMGMMRIPLSKDFELTKIFSVLHNTLLRTFSTTEQLILRDTSGCDQWGKGVLPKDKKEKLEEVKGKWRKRLGPLLGYKDKQCPNQITGGLCEKFFGEELREQVVEVIGDMWKVGHDTEMTSEQKNNYRRYLQEMNILRRVAVSNSKVRIRPLWSFVIKLHIFIVDTWGFFKFGKAFHRFLDHLVEHLILNGNRGLKNQSEQSIESSHHVGRDDRRDLARKDNLEHNAYDVVMKKWVASDPGVRSLDIYPSCKTCGETGHWTVSCPLKTGPCHEIDNPLVL